MVWPQENRHQGLGAVQETLGCDSLQTHKTRSLPSLGSVTGLWREMALNQAGHIQSSGGALSATARGGGVEG